MIVNYDRTKHFSPRTGDYIVYGYLLVDGEQDVSAEVAEFLIKEGVAVEVVLPKAK